MILRGKGIIELILNWMNPEYGSFSMMFSHPAILLGLVHSYLPYMILTCYVSLQAIDETLIEAARSLGAGRMMILWKLIIPLSFPGISAGTVLIFVPVVGSFMEPRILGGSEGTFIGTIIEDQFVKVFNWPLGAALSFIMLALVMVILLVAYSISKKWT
jgi:spermidine/putrescine transport system permease protein|tara:strand:+ start:154 stop:630 length:477 start_codon:yes stop_codon:yes gene_type:complete